MTDANNTRDFDDSLITKLFIIHKAHRMQYASHRLFFEKKYWDKEVNAVWASFTPDSADDRGDWLADVEWSGPYFQQGPDDMDYDWGTYTHAFESRARAREWIICTLYDMWLDGFQPITDGKLSYLGVGHGVEPERFTLENMRSIWDLFELEPPVWEVDGTDARHEEIN